MAAKKYLVKLTPHDKFFFGGERTFGQSNSSNYLVRSNDFPQQTAILGLIRYQLLRESNLFDKTENKILKSEKDNVSTLIGGASFDVNKAFEFGAIQSLSPLFILREQEGKPAYYFPANNEYQLNEKTEEREFLEIEKKGGTSDKVYTLSKYQAKYGLHPFYIQKENYDDFLKRDDIFVEHKQTGIRKNYDGKTENEAYYIQYFKKFKNSLKTQFSFAFILELDEHINPEKLNQPKVVLGGEQQTFKMECFENPPDLDEIIPDYQPSQQLNKVVLVSDAFVNEKVEIANKYDFAITDTVDFRFLKTTVETTENYADMDREGNENSKKVTKSEKFSLYRKGSVFYANDTTQIEAVFKNKEFSNFKNLGYNEIKVVPKKQNKNGNNK
ncbi:MAG: type III-B CRISPR module-associated protein Cmr3 [Flavobacteriales bacterium]|nr:type III-B CRISPR module-associated protein Cmr3 [Flavobacteriales bacterium]